MKIVPVVNINGLLVDIEDAKISVFDRGFLYGDSIYEVTRTYNRIPVLLDEHLDRLWYSAERLSIPMIHSRELIKNEINKTLVKLNQDDAYIRVIITRGEGEIGLDPNLSTNNNLIIITKHLKGYPSWWYEDGVTLITAQIMRNPKNATDPSIKSGNYLNNVMAMTEASKQKAFDAIMLNQQGFVTEGTCSNIWIIKDGVINTPPLHAGILDGITKQQLLKLIKERGLKASELNFTPDDIKNSDECFMSSSTREIVPVKSLDGVTIGTGKPGIITKQLMSLYKNSTRAMTVPK